MPSSPPDFPLLTILRAVREHLGMDAVFLTRVRDGTEVWLAGDGGVERFGPVREGASLPVAETYCRHVVESDQLRVVLDTAASDFARRLTVTRTAGIGAYVGAAVRLKDGTVYGTLCCLSRNPSPAIGDQRLAFVESLAEIAGAWLDDARLSEHELRARHDAARAQASRGRAAATLSEREREILARVAEGQPVEPIAQDLGLSAHTVRNHLRNAYEKLGVQTQAAAVAKALRERLID